MFFLRSGSVELLLDVADSRAADGVVVEHDMNFGKAKQHRMKQEFIKPADFMPTHPDIATNWWRYVRFKLEDRLYGVDQTIAKKTELNFVAPPIPSANQI
jgi:hypothetical protein